MSEWTIFGERLKKQLEECGMTYREFAEKVGLSVPTICRYVHCQMVPKATEILKIANVLGVNCNYLLGVIDDPYRDCLPHPKESTVAENATVQGDLISRQDAIDALDEQIRQCDKALSAFDISMKDEYAVKVERASLVAFRETLEYMPSANPTCTESVPVGDCVSRQDVIDTLAISKEFLLRVLDDMDVVGQEREKYSWELGLIESYINDIEELPSAEPEHNCSEIPNNWTPVSKETNPSTSGWYIVTCPEEMTASNERFSSIAEYNAVTGEWFDMDEPTDCYLAWMPLPAPFRPKEE